MKRLHQATLVISTLLASWLAMQAVHEFGHVAGAWVTGGEVVRVVLYPLTISRTDLGHNPAPLLVVWAGPICGVVLPLALWAAVAALPVPGVYVLRFFAGFCLIANGCYIAFGSLDAVGDCGEMMRHGSPIWLLWLFGVGTIPAGFWLWHGQGKHFGLGVGGTVDMRVAYTTLAAALLLGIFGFAAASE